MTSANATNNGILMESIKSVLQYIEVQLSESFCPLGANEGDNAGLLRGSGGTQDPASKRLQNTEVAMSTATMKGNDNDFTTRIQQGMLASQRAKARNVPVNRWA